RDLDVVVLESSDRVGGRVRSERRGRYWLNFGAHVFAGAGSATDVLLQETGVEAADVPGVLTGLELDGRVVARRRVESYPFRLPLPLTSRLALVRAGIRIRLGVARYDRVVRTGDTRRVLSYLSDRTFADWLGPVPADVDAVVRPTLQRSSGEPEELAAGYGIGYFHLVWDRSGGLARNILGGPSTLAEAVAAARRSFNLFYNMANVLRPRETERERGGSLMVYSGAGLGRRLWDEDDGRVRELYLADLDGMFPGASGVVEEVVVHRWERGVPYVRPGRQAVQDAPEAPPGPIF